MTFYKTNLLYKAAPWHRRASLLGLQEDLRRLRSGNILVHFGSIFDLLGEFWALLELSRGPPCRLWLPRGMDFRHLPGICTTCLKLCLKGQIRFKRQARKLHVGPKGPLGSPNPKSRISGEGFPEGGAAGLATGLWSPNPDGTLRTGKWSTTPHPWAPWAPRAPWDPTGAQGTH